MLLHLESSCPLGKALKLQDKVRAIAVVYGKVERYKDIPQIVNTNPEQLVIIKDEEVPASEVPIKDDN